MLLELLPQEQQEQERQVPLQHQLFSWLMPLLLAQLVLPELGWLELLLAPRLLHHQLELQPF